MNSTSFGVNIPFVAIEGFFEVEDLAVLSAVSKRLEHNCLPLLYEDNPGFPRGQVINELEKSCFTRLKEKSVKVIRSIKQRGFSDLKTRKFDKDYALAVGTIIAYAGIFLTWQLKPENLLHMGINESIAHTIGKHRAGIGTLISSPGLNLTFENRVNANSLVFISLVVLAFFSQIANDRPHYNL